VGASPSRFAPRSGDSGSRFGNNSNDDREVSDVSDRNPRALPSRQPSLTLDVLCEPLFQYICLLNRSARSGSVNFEQVRREVAELFRDLRQRATADVQLLAQFERVELALVCFVDFIIAMSSLAFASQWNDSRLAYERSPSCMTGDEEFFNLLDATLSDRTPAATERLVIFYTCMGLGFSGQYTGQPEYLKRKMQECATRLRDVMTQNRGRICEEAYENVDTRNFIEKPARSLVGFGLALALMAIVLFVANVVMYRTASGELNTALQKIIKWDSQSSTPSVQPGK